MYVCTYVCIYAKRNHRFQDRPRKVAVCFWHCLNNDDNLPHAICEGLKSTANAGFAAVHLLTYQFFNNVPAHVTVVNASCIMPHGRLVQLYESGKTYFPVKVAPGKSVHMAHSPVICLISDVFRLRYAAMIRRCDFSHVCVIDADTTWLAEWTSLGFFGFEFASLVENPSSFENIDIVKRKIRRLKEYCIEPGDTRKLVTPFQFVPETHIIETINEHIDHLCPTTGEFPHVTDWGFVMDHVLKAVNDHGLRGAIVHQDVFCPVPWFARLRPTQAGSVHLPILWRMSVRMYVCTLAYVCTDVCMYVCTYLCMYVCMYVHVFM